MKKLILLFLPLLSVLANAEELKFVTVLSSPVGTFNKLEAVDSTTPAKSPVINFCTSIGTGGTVTLKGTSKPEMKTVNLSQNTILGREDTGNYVLNQITMKSGGTLKGSRLLAGTVQVNQATAGKSDKLYTDTLTVAGAKAGKLYVNGKEAYIESGASDPGMMWSNQYQSDKACGDKCKDQYLLKQQGGSFGAEEDEEDNLTDCFVYVYDSYCVLTAQDPRGEAEIAGVFDSYGLSTNGASAAKSLDCNSPYASSGVVKICNTVKRMLESNGVRFLYQTPEQTDFKFMGSGVCDGSEVYAFPSTYRIQKRIVSAGTAAPIILWQRATCKKREKCSTVAEGVSGPPDYTGCNID